MHSLLLMDTTQRRHDERSLTELLSDATQEGADLMRKEVELARLEIASNIADVKSGITGLAMAAPLLYAGVLVLLLAAVLGIDRVIQEPWLSALLVGGAVTLAGGLTLLGGRRRMKRASLTPRQSIESLRDDKLMLQRRLGAGG